MLRTLFGTVVFALRFGGCFALIAAKSNPSHARTTTKPQAERMEAANVSAASQRNELPAQPSIPQWAQRPVVIQPETPYTPRWQPPAIPSPDQPQNLPQEQYVSRPPEPPARPASGYSLQPKQGQTAKPKSNCCTSCKKK